MRRRIVPATVVALVLAAGAFAGAGYGGAGRHGAYPGSLTASPSVVQVGGYFDVTGCGYDTSLGPVIVSFAGASYASSLDANGCFTVTDVVALSGDTLAPGTYTVGAWQYLRRKLVETGETSVTVSA